MFNMLRLLAIPALAYLLTACSPHPGAGYWQTTGEESPNFIKEFVRLEVGYEGRTNIFDSKTATPEQAIRRCFWSGVDAQTLMLTCVQASNTDIEESYQLRVSPDNNTADLLKDETIIGHFMREKRPEIEHSYKEIFQPQ
ncbi:MAG: hypothetical protein OEL79_02805 [Chromatiales bacterium]|nr:hypothetical protein [Chromatiales bacterium]